MLVTQQIFSQILFWVWLSKLKFSYLNNSFVNLRCNYIYFFNLLKVAFLPFYQNLLTSFFFFLRYFQIIQYCLHYFWELGLVWKGRSLFLGRSSFGLGTYSLEIVVEYILRFYLCFSICCHLWYTKSKCKLKQDSRSTVDFFGKVMVCWLLVEPCEFMKALWYRASIWSGYSQAWNMRINREFWLGT